MTWGRGNAVTYTRASPGLGRQAVTLRGLPAQQSRPAARSSLTLTFPPILYVVLRLAQGVKSEGAYGAAPDYVRRPLRAPQSRPIYESCHFPRCGLRQTCFRVVETEVSVLRPIGPGLVTAPIRPRRFVSRVLSTSCLVRKVVPREVCRGGALVPRSGSGCALGAYFPEHGLFEIITLGS